MFLTKKHLSRRTVLKAAGVSLSLPLLDAMIPAHTALAQTAAAAKLRAGFFYIPHGAIMWNTPYGPASRRVDAERRRRRLQAEPDSVAARAAQALRHVVRQPREQGAAGLRAHDRAGHVAVGREAGPEGHGRDDGADDRPDDRREDRRRLRAAVARGVVGDDDAERGLRHGRVLLQLDAVVPQRDDAAADGVQPAQGVRAAVRRRRHARGARRCSRAAARACST